MALKTIHVLKKTKEAGGTKLENAGPLPYQTMTRPFLKLSQAVSFSLENHISL